jgi:hypothetical protein
MLIVVDLVGADARGDAGEYRFGASLFGQCLVEGGGAGFDHASGDHLESRRGLELVERALARVVFEECGVGAIPVELRPDVADIGVQGPPVSHFLLFPAVLQPADQFRLASTVVDQIAGIEVRAAFDERGCRHQVEQVLPSVDPLQVYRLQRSPIEAPCRCRIRRFLHRELSRTLFLIVMRWAITATQRYRKRTRRESQHSLGLSDLLTP